VTHSEVAQHSGRRFRGGLFATSIFCAAALLFQLEPLAGKSLLPWYGGTPAVWNTCILFFQFVLLLGYLYAHGVNRFPLRVQVALHTLLLGAVLFSLPLRFQITGLVSGQTSPVGAVLWDLFRSTGLLLFAVSATAPLLQSWYCSATNRANPYWLYVASNAGSLASLLIYPSLIEFWWPLSLQAAVISGAMVALFLMILACGLVALRRPSTPVSDESISTAPGAAMCQVTGWDRGRWFVWSMLPSSLMLGVTTALSTDIAPMPAIWIFPLALYLLSFMIAFADPPRAVLAASSIGYLLLSLAVAASDARGILGLAMHGGLLLCACVALHGRLAQTRPQLNVSGKTNHALTEFYLWISFGGLCGSAVNTLIAPVTLNWMAEYPLAIALGLMLSPLPRGSTLWNRATLAGRILASVTVLAGMSWDVFVLDSSHRVLLRGRSFFGAFRVETGRDDVTHQLVHGGTGHGAQIFNARARDRLAPLTYYFVTGPVGQVFLSGRAAGLTQSVGVVGLGIGSLAGYSLAGESYTFYEIDPAIADIAEDPEYFTFLADARSRGVRIEVELGDARLRLREAAEDQFGILVLDAFTSDAIPIHLLTREAIAEYLTRLKPDGLLACHISNVYIDLEPVLANIARDLGLVAYVQIDAPISDADRQRGKSPSIWLVMARSAGVVEPLVNSGRWRPARRRDSIGVWTDERSNLLSVLRAR